jgi:hypothetical protein
LNPRIEAISEQMASTLADAKSITSRAKAEKRSLTAAEDRDVTMALDNCRRMKAERDSLIEADREAREARSATGKSLGWKAVASPLSKGERNWSGRLIDILGKGAEVDDLEDRAIKVEAGVRPLLQDTRRLFSLLPSSDPGTALHVENLVIDHEGLESGVVERDPLSTSAKAEANVAIRVDSVDLKQYAVMSGMIPNAAFRSVSQLSPAIQAAMGRELDKALDAAAFTALAAALPATVSGGGSTMDQLRIAKGDLIAAGAEGPFIAVISDEDAAVFDLTTEVDMPRGFPFGLTIVSLPGINPGEGFVFSREALHLYQGAARLDSDPYTGFETNQTQLRLEYEALAVVREPGAIVALEPLTS